MSGRSSPPRPGRPPYVTLWLCTFVLTAVSAAVIQFVVLGLIFPEWSNGLGLLLNTDSIGYHNMAVEMANRVATEGWAVWELAPSAHFSVGSCARVDDPSSRDGSAPGTARSCARAGSNRHSARAPASTRSLPAARSAPLNGPG